MMARILLVIVLILFVWFVPRHITDPNKSNEIIIIDSVFQKDSIQNNLFERIDIVYEGKGSIYDKKIIYVVDSLIRKESNGEVDGIRGVLKSKIEECVYKKEESIARYFAAYRRKTNFIINKKDSILNN